MWTHTNVSTLLGCALLVALGSGVAGLQLQPLPPVFVLEDTAIGSLLFNVTAEATSGSGSSLDFSVHENVASLVNLTQPFSPGPGTWEVGVILKAELDRDYDAVTRYISISVSDGSNTATRVFPLVILDVNDNAPSFVNLPYHVTVPESTAIGEVVKGGISATDPDNSGLAPSPYRLWADEAAVEAMFQLQPVPGNPGLAEVRLTASLDFESRSSYTLHLSATDAGGLNTTVDMVVTVSGVQDTPPTFLIDTYRAAVDEERPSGTSVVQVQAQDGDLGETNRVLYSILQGNTSYFAIDAVSGVIVTRSRLDREASDVIDTDGVFHLLVQAEEMNDTWPQLGNTTATVDVFIRLEDVNDNAPTFRNQTFTAFIREDASLDSIIYLDGDGYIQVYDADQGPNANFQLTVERGGVPFPVFRPSPLNVYSIAFVLVRLNSSSALRDFVGSHLDFQVVAREVSTSQQLSSSATVLLAVEAAVVMTTTAAPTLIQRMTGSDVVVYAMGAVVLFCAVLVVFVIYRLTCYRPKPKLSRQRTGSKMLKYYVNLPTPGFSPFRPGIQTAPSISSLDSSELGQVMTSDKAKDEIPSPSGAGLDSEEPAVTPIYSTPSRQHLVPVTLEAEGRTHM